MKIHLNISLKTFWILVTLVSSASAQTKNTIAEEVRRHCSNLPFAMPQIPVPTFPDHRVNIVDYGAVADGYTMNTRAFADAISTCAKLGGGTVVVPPGTWLTGPIKLESNINLHIERGALIQFSRRFEDFPLIAGFDGKSKRYIVTPPIYAFRSKNVAITGDGIVDGAGDSWRYVKKEKQTERQWKDLVASGGIVTPDGKEWWPSKEAMEAESYLKRLEETSKPLVASDYAKAREFLRTDMVQFVQCDGILLDGVTFQNSPRFHVRPTQSENIIIRDLKILAPWYAQNADGIDLASCRKVIVYNTIVDAGDDGICLKPGTIAQSQRRGPACENIVVVDCVVYRAHGGFVIGSESYGGVNNVYVRNCVFSGTDVGLRFKSARGRGGLVENIFIDGIQMRGIENEAILFDMYYGGGAPEDEAVKDLSIRKSEPVTDRTPRFQNFSVKNVVCNGANRSVVVNGLPEMTIKNIALENVSVSSKLGVFCADADGISFIGCRFVPQTGPVLTFIQTRNVTVRGGTFVSPADFFLKVIGEKSGNIRLTGIAPPIGRKAIDLGKEVKADAVIVEQ